MSEIVKAGADTRLWCLHTIGPDEVYPAPDFATAQQWANYANAAFAKGADILRFVVAIWPWNPERHSAGLDASIKLWTLPETATPEPAPKLDAAVSKVPHWHKIVDDLLNTCGARGRYHAFEYGDAIKAAESALSALATTKEQS